MIFILSKEINIDNRDNVSSRLRVCEGESGYTVAHAGHFEEEEAEVTTNLGDL